MYCFRYTTSVCKHKKTILLYRVGQNIKIQTVVHIFTKYWWILQTYVSQGSVATQLRCGYIFSNRFITNFVRSANEKTSKIGKFLVKIWTEVCGLYFSPHRIWQFLTDFPWYHHVQLTVTRCCLNCFFLVVNVAVLRFQKLMCHFAEVTTTLLATV